MQEYPAFQMSIAYAMAMRVAAVAFFYMPKVPVGGVYLLITLTLLYWSDKQVLISYSNKLVSYSGYISQQLLGDIEILVALFIAGLCLKNYLLSQGRHEPYNLLNINLALSAAVLILSFFEVFAKTSDWIFQSFKSIKKVATSMFWARDQEADHTYEQVMAHYALDYHKRNPAQPFFHLHTGVGSYPQPVHSPIFAPTNGEGA